MLPGRLGGATCGMHVGDAEGAGSSVTTHRGHGGAGGARIRPRSRAAQGRAAAPKPAWPVGSFLAVLPSENHRDLFGRADRRTQHRRGDYVLVQGQAGGKLAVVLAGGLKEVLSGDDGKAHLLDLPGRGDLLGATSYLDSVPHFSSHVALCDVDLLWISAEAFTLHLAALPESATALARSIAQRVAAAHRFRVENSAENMELRVVCALVRLARSVGRGQSVEPVQVPMTQTDVAQYAEVSPVTVSRVLRALRPQGFVRAGYAEITVPCTQCLARVADQLRSGDGDIESAQGCRCGHRAAVAPY